MEQTATQSIFVAACLDRRMLLQRIGLLIFLASMPLDVLNGHGRGFLADPNHFQGWEVAFFFGFVLASWTAAFEWPFVVFLSIGIMTAFTLTMPFVDLSKPGVGTRIARIEKTVGVASFALTAFFVVNWAIRDDNGDGGGFWGAIPWLLGPALVVIGTLCQKAKKTPVRRSWSFSLRTMFIGMTALAVLAAIIGAYNARPTPVVLFAVLVAAMAVPAFLRVAEPTIDQPAGNDRSENSIAR